MLRSYPGRNIQRLRQLRYESFPATRRLIVPLTPIAPAGLMGEVTLVGAGGLLGAPIYGVLAIVLRMQEVGLLGQMLLEKGRRLTVDRR